VGLELNLPSLLAAIEAPANARLDGDEAALLALARRHRLTPLLSAVASDALPTTMREACRRDRVTTAARNLALVEVAEQVASALLSADVPVIVLKGLAYEVTIYPTAGVRPTSDIDLLVPLANRAAAFAAMDRLGFEPRGAAPAFDDADYHEVAWTRAGAEVDLHLGLAPFVRCAIDYDEVWAGMRELTLRRTRLYVLAAAHAAVFHALHMAIDHFAVPAIYLIDFARLLPDADAVDEAAALARRWRCHRAFVTARALAEALLPVWASAHPPGAVPWFAARVVAGYAGGTLPRSLQLVRKFVHFDTPGFAFRYLATQGWRNARELYERRVRHRSPRARLGLPNRA
jgi:hypothetical protein